MADKKIKRGDDDMVIRLSPTHDIAAALGKAKTTEQTIVAFALETNDEEANAQRKLEKKNADFIVLNSLQNKGTCFRTDDNQIEIISRSDKKEYPTESRRKAYFLYRQRYYGAFLVSLRNQSVIPVPFQGLW